jgi:hypothetical protein
MDETELKTINERIGEAEQTADEEFLRQVLADELVFRKAGGSVVTKQQFLADLAKNNFARETKNVKVTLDEEKQTALVSLVVHALGSDFQNLRLFVRRETGWQCIVWFNTKLT